MAKIIAMPKLSDTMEEGGIANWLKKEGDQIEEGDPLVEIETDKATQEYESPEEGVLVKIVADQGSTVALGAPIAVLGEDGEKVDVDALLAKRAVGGGAPAAETAEAKAEPLPTPAAAPEVTGPGGRIKSSPLARKVAQEKGLDLTRIAGSGPGGRVVVRDVEQAAASGKAAAAPVGRVVMPSGEDRTQPVSMMRKTIAKRLVSAKNDAPHFYLTVSANMERMNVWRQRLNEEAARSEGAIPKVSVNDLVILAVANALKRHPMVNTSWQGDTILQHGSIHVAMAVALPEGLVTPVIRNADQLGIRDIAIQSRQFAQQAKAGQLKNEDYAGGTFTISNLGMFGIEEFTAIINPPQAAILAVGATRSVPWVNEDGELAVQQRMKMTMSCDHRVVDGAIGAQFLQTLVSYLEDPLMILS